MESMNTGN